MTLSELRRHDFVKIENNLVFDALFEVSVIKKLKSIYTSEPVK